MEEKAYQKNISCKNCKTEFVVNFKMSDQGSIAKCNKLYCSKLCKKEYLRKNGTSNSIEFVCSYCKCAYYKPKSLSKNSKFCSRVCQNRSYACRNKKEKKKINC